LADISQKLILDPGNSPLSVLNLAAGTDRLDPASSYVLTSHAFPLPQVQRLAASALETEGDVPGDAHWANRQITVGFDVRGSTHTALKNALRAVDAKVAKLATDGGELQWTLPAGQTVTFDVTGVDGYEGTYDQTFYVGRTVPVTLTLSARPFGRGAEVKAGATFSETTKPILTFVTPTIAGDVPATGRLVMWNTTNLSSDWRTMIWGLEQGGYQVATGPFLYEAESQTLTGGAFPLTAGTVTVSGASNGQVVEWTMPTANTTYGLLGLKDPANSSGNGVLKLYGRFRVFARVSSTNSSQARVAVQWWPSWIGFSETNYEQNAFSSFIVPNSPGQYQLKDLGTVDLGYDGQAGGGVMVVGRGTSATTNVRVDYVVLVPTERYGQGRAMWDDQYLVVAGDRAYTQASATLGGGRSRPDQYFGDYLRVPPGVSRVAVVASTQHLGHQVAADGNLAVDGQDAPSGILDQFADLYVSPRYLTVPD
jgi:hypothetical protein